MSGPARNDGGPAFPCEWDYINSNRAAANGMTLRDYFAAQSIPVIWDAYDKGYCGLNEKDEPNVDLIARGAYAMADAMLAARDAA